MLINDDLKKPFSMLVTQIESNPYIGKWMTHYSFYSSNHSIISSLLHIVWKYNSIQLNSTSPCNAGKCFLGRIQTGTIKLNDKIKVINANGTHEESRVMKLFTKRGLDQMDLESASAVNILFTHSLICLFLCSVIYSTIPAFIFLCQINLFRSSRVI